MTGIPACRTSVKAGIFDQSLPLMAMPFHVGESASGPGAPIDLLAHDFSASGAQLASARPCHSACDPMPSRGGSPVGIRATQSSGPVLNAMGAPSIGSTVGACAGGSPRGPMGSSGLQPSSLSRAMSPPAAIPIPVGLGMPAADSCVLLGHTHTHFHAGDDPFAEHPSEAAISGGSGELPMHSGGHIQSTHAQARQSAPLPAGMHPEEAVKQHRSSRAGSHSGMALEADQGKNKAAAYPVNSVRVPGGARLSQTNTHASGQPWGMSPTHATARRDMYSHADGTRHMMHADVSVHDPMGRSIGQHHSLMASAMQPNTEELWKTALHKQVELQRNLQEQLDVRPLLQVPAWLLCIALKLYYCSITRLLVSYADSSQTVNQAVVVSAACQFVLQ